MGILPQNPQVPKSLGFPTRDTWLIYGQPKIGKTTLASQFPDPIILDLEAGASQVKGYVCPITNMDQLREAYDELEADKGRKFKTAIIDSIDIVYEWVEQETCEYLSAKQKITLENIGEAAHGADWAEARKRLMGLVAVWRSLPINIVFIAHAKAVMAEKGSVVEKSRTIDLPGKLAHRFPAKVDTIAFCFAQRKIQDSSHVIERLISFQPYEELEAGSRRKELQGKIIPMSFEAIRACFGGSQKPAKKA